MTYKKMKVPEPANWNRGVGTWNRTWQDGLNMGEGGKSFGVE